MPHRSWSRDNRILTAIAAGLGLAFALLYALVLRTRTLPPGAAVNRVLLFVLFYVVVLLILVLLFVLVRSGVKLLLETRRGVFGSRFRVRIVATNVGLALLPIALLLLPTTGLLQRSVERWFRPPVAETAHAGREVSELVRKRAGALERRTAERVAVAMAAAADDAARYSALAAAREASGLDLLEWRPEAGPPLAVSSARWPVSELRSPSPEWRAEARSAGGARRVEETHDGGLASRTLLLTPGGLLSAGTYDPPDEARSLRTLARASASYAMLEAERASLEAFQILLFLLLAFLVLLAAVWVGLVLARRVTRPIAALAASVERVGAGDFTAKVAVEGGDEIATLALAFNAMTVELRKSREGLEATNRRLDEERRRVQTVLSHLEAGVVAFAEDRALIFANDAARRLLAREGQADPSTVDELFAAPALAPVAALLAATRRPAGSAIERREATFELASGGDRLVLEVRLAHVPGEPPGPASWIVLLEDTTALVKAERASAWRDAAQRMAHEIKNPLTPIRLAAERMRRRATAIEGNAGPADALAPIVIEGASTIVEEVRTLAELVDAFRRFARLPSPTFADVDLGAVVQQVTKLYDGVKDGVEVFAELSPEMPPVRGDAEQLKRALVNLVDNAVAATPRGGRIAVHACLAAGQARLTVTDDGPGIPAEARGRIFDPDYSTKSRGTGLGLAITARIAAEHSGRVRLEENRPQGCRFVLEWPAG